ncbi:MAG: response regulator [Chloroflexales bacterium]|nr:response regulator [Chloroflexales bacterium]
MRVLYVEDNALDADLTRRSLQRSSEPIKLTVVGTWHDAMACLAQPDYDLVLSDINLPDGDGMRILDHIRAQNLPLAVVMITGLDEEEAAVAALRAGADDFVIKRAAYLDHLPATLADALARSQLLRAQLAVRLRVAAIGLSLNEHERIRRHLDRYAPHIVIELAADPRALIPGLRGGEEIYDVVLVGDSGSALQGLATLKHVRYELGAAVPVVLLADQSAAELALQAMRLGAADYIVRHPGYLAHLPLVLEKCYSQTRQQRLMYELRRANAGLEATYDSTLEGWARALELRDHETEDHARRVTDLTMRMVKAYGVNNGQLAHIRRGALLHDIGKMGVPDSILRKPGPLTDEEWAVMRRHPTYAYEMLSPISFLGPALEIPWCHHERWDGAGYPRGLRGEEIPVSARLFAVIDVWDAVTSDRPYRKALAQDEALAIIRGGAGSHFDPRAVELFMGLAPWEQ